MSAALEYITSPTLFRHVKRDEWGIARVMSEGPFRRRLQFEDGQRRTFKRDYYHLLEVVDAPDPEAKASLDALVDEARAAMGARAPKRRARPAANPTAALTTQIDAFLAEYPEGFEDPKWRSEVRGAGASRGKKAFRDPIVEKGPALLSQENLRSSIEARGADAVFDELTRLLRTTDLAVIKTDVKPLEAVGEAGRAEILGALLEAQTGRGTAAYDGLVGKLEQNGVKATWTLVSAMLALSDPKTVGPVRSATLRKQGKLLGHSRSLPNRPSGQGHEAAQAILQQVRNALIQRELTPADMMDVADFIAATVSKV